MNKKMLALSLVASSLVSQSSFAYPYEKTIVMVEGVLKYALVLTSPSGEKMPMAVDADVSDGALDGLVQIESRIAASADYQSAMNELSRVASKVKSIIDAGGSRQEMPGRGRP